MAEDEMSTPWDIVLFSMIDFDFLWQRPQQIMCEFWKRGARILFVEPPIIEFSTSGLRTFFSRKVFRLREVRDSFYVYKPVATLYLLMQLHLPLSLLRDALTYIEMSRLLKSIGFDSRRPLIFWINDPYLITPHISNLMQRTTLVVYDCIDKWSAFEPLAPYAAYILRNEAHLASRADMVFVTSRALQEHLAKHARLIHLVRNAADLPHFAITKNIPEAVEMATIRRPIAGYAGAISSWMDWELLYRVGRKLPEFSFVFVGPIMERIPQRIRELPNFHFLGLRPYAELPSYLKAMDVCIIPFKINDLTTHVDPVKLYEYRAAQKPVVTVALQEITDMHDKSIFVAETPVEFGKMIEKAVSTEVRNGVEESLRSAENSWSTRADEITAILRPHLSRELTRKNTESQ